MSTRRCAAEFARRPVQVSAAPALRDVGQKLASPFLDLLATTGLAIAVLDQLDKTSVVHASDDTAAQLEELRFDLGEGPLFDCFTTTRPILIPDVAAPARSSCFR